MYAAENADADAPQQERERERDSSSSFRNCPRNFPAMSGAAREDDRV
jgi:hypothetical protein